MPKQVYMNHADESGLRDTRSVTQKADTWTAFVQRGSRRVGAFLFSSSNLDVLGSDLLKHVATSAFYEICL